MHRRGPTHLAIIAFLAGSVGVLPACGWAHASRLHSLPRPARSRALAGVASELRARMHGAAGSTASALQLSTLFAQRADTIKQELKPDPQNEALFPNQDTRECAGHWVEVRPTALPEPFLVSFSADMAATIGLDPAECGTPEFARFFAGDVDALRADPPADTEGAAVRPWATPYAVSVFGHAIMAPDPFGRGNAYGDGRALTLAELACPSGERWELQLKGAGTTPFSRGGDGRAVLRSSVREYLVSEAMHHLRVPTTRALCLVASRTEYIRRMWYAENDRGRDHPPDTVIRERCAITCRAAPSFLRVGHLELHARRAARGEPGAAGELEALVRHALKREFAEEVDAAMPLRAQLLDMTRAFARRQAALAVGWLRVGYVQGNMNSDNCLLNGRTMDYGPFGFVEEYDELWSPFTSDMERKFGFERQPLAAQVNVMTLARALLPLLEHLGEASAVPELQAIVQDEYAEELEAQRGQMVRAKLGLRAWDGDAAQALYPRLRALMQKSRVDYTILWRQLSHISTDDARALVAGDAQPAALLATLAPAFYDDAAAEATRGEWEEWLALYATRIVADARDPAERVSEMRRTSPKYVPREWMLVQAYRAAEEGDYSVLELLAGLFREPFDEHPELEGKYYQRTPEPMRGAGGVSYFS